MDWVHNPIEGLGMAKKKYRYMENDKKKADEEVKRLNALLRAEQDAVCSGILVVGPNGKVLNYNKRFLEIWNIPEGLVKKGEDSGLLSYVEGSAKDRDAFINTMQHLDRNPNLPPKYPAINPKVTPMTEEMPTTVMPTPNEIREP